MESKVCKKCGRTLPDGCKRKYCESCRTKKIGTTKKWIRTGFKVGEFVVYCYAFIRKGVPTIANLLNPSKKADDSNKNNS